MRYDWTKMDLVPLGDLEAWHQHEPGVSASNFVGDYSGKGRHLTCASSGAPVLTPNVLNGEPGWYFNGTSNFLNYTGSVLVRHIFILASFDEATFAAYRGLLSDTGANAALLVGKIGTNLFFDFSASYASDYRLADVRYAADDQKAPVAGVPQLIELQIPAGIGLDAIQIGQQTGLTSRKHKGYFFEMLAYSTLKNDLQRLRIYQYNAMRRRVWQRNAAGLYVFPFPSDKVTSLERDQESYISEPYAGDIKVLTRGDYKSALGLPFRTRRQQEFEAAEVFHEQHGKAAHFIFRDLRYLPAKDRECRFTSAIREQGSDVTYRFNYSFDVVEVDPTIVPDTTPPSVPTGLTAIATTETSITFTWDLSTD